MIVLTENFIGQTALVRNFSISQPSLGATIRKLLNANESEVISQNDRQQSSNTYKFPRAIALDWSSRNLYYVEL